MSLKYNHEQRLEYLAMSDAVGKHWLTVFEGDTTFYAVPYWDLFKELWRRNGEVKKTDAIGFIAVVKSSPTAAKHVDAAIAKGFLVERENPEDSRSKLVGLSEPMRERLDQFFDTAVTELRKTNAKINEKRPSPKES